MSSIGYVASSWSRVIVPSIIGLSTSAANSALTSANLSVGTVTTTTSGATSGNNGTVATQSISAGTDAERSTSVSYVTYDYVETPPPPLLGIWYAYCGVNSGPEGPLFTTGRTCQQQYDLLTQFGEVGSNWSCAIGYSNDTNKAGITAPFCDI